MSKCYFAHGGDELVIGGKLTFLPAASVTGAKGLLELPAEISKQPLFVADSTASTVAGLRDDFNRLLSALRSMGILAMESGGGGDG